ncbi:MAG: rhodanese-like domain-containing protein [Desulfovibrio sp.]|jgi:rhodanese-related sulfurtransferase|nr:rhodanese-like domain-containing protein [Desulfovibrio sp.]
MRYKTPIITAAILLLAFSVPARAGAEGALTNYITSFNYTSRKDMKASSSELVQWLLNDEAVLVDIRFPEEQALWGFDFARKIPLPELPKRLAELPKDKIIVTACPHNDRSNIAMVYLTTQGYRAKYLTDGMRGLAELLRGDNAKLFYEAMQRKK